MKMLGDAGMYPHEQAPGSMAERFANMETWSWDFFDNVYTSSVFCDIWTIIFVLS